MSAYKSKLVFITILLFCAIPVALSMPAGDRWFAVVAWLVFCGFVGILVVLVPTLHCPDCGRATKYLDNYYEWSERLTGGVHRNVKCNHCGCIIDRLSGAGVARIPRDEARIVDRLAFYFRMRLSLYLVGCALIFCSVGIGAIMLRLLIDGNARQDRAFHVLIGCGAVFLVGLASLATGWRLKRKANAFAEKHGVELQEGVRVTW